MLLRNAGHGIASAITLEFLAPSLIRSKFVTRTVATTPARPRPRGDRKPSIAPSTPPSPRRSPSALLRKLDEQLQVFHGRSGPSDSQAEIFNRATPELRTALREKDIRRAWSIWLSLEKEKLLAFFGPSHYEMYSTTVAAIFSGTPADHQWDEIETQALQNIAVFTAAGGATDGLLACMTLYIKRRDPETVVRLYDRYFSLLEKKVAWKGVECVADTRQDEVELDLGPTEQDALATSVRGDILLAAVTAHAMRGSFSDALLTCLPTAIRLTPNNLWDFMTRLEHDPALRERVQDYVRRLEYARLVARPPALMKQLSNLTRDNADISLEKLYTSIIEGAAGSEPWLAFRASDLNTQRLVLLPDFAWASFLTSFLRCRRRDLGVRLWDDMIKFNIPLDVVVWNALIDGYAGLREGGEAVNAWNLMLEQKIKPDALTYRALIHALFNSGRPMDAMQRFRAFEQEFRNSKLRPDDSTVIVVYNTVLHDLLLTHQEAEAQSILLKIEADGPKPDIITYNTFLAYYAKKGDLRALANTLKALGPAGVVGDVFTFSTILSALIKVRSDAAQIMINFMKMQGVKPNTATLSTIIDYQMKQQTEQNFKMALELLTRMEQNEFEDAQPNEVTYTSILMGIHRGNWLDPKVAEEYGQLLWEKMRSRNIQPKRTTYNILIKACLENPESEGVQAALRYYNDMVKRRVFIANDTWYIIIRGLMDRKEWALAHEIVVDLRRSGLEPSSALSDLAHRVRKRVNEMMKAGPASYF